MSHVRTHPDGPRPARPSRRAVTASAVLGAFLVASGADVAAARTASADLRLRLPAPTGPHPVGLTTWYLVDRSRRDPWDGAIPVRELVATVFYPARGVRRHPPAPQLGPATAAVFGALAPYQHPGLPPAGVDWAATMTHAHQDAPASPVRRPVLLYSPGGGDPRGFGTGLAQDLAGHGFVVVAVDHPGDALVVEFPATTDFRDDVVRTTAFRQDPRADPATFATMIRTRIADLRFVLDQVEFLAAGGNPDAAGRPLPEGLARAVDPRRVGVYGHSAGGTAAAQTTYDDRRVGAAVDLEGYLDHPGARPGETGPLFPVAEYGVNRPLLLWGTDGFPDRAGMERSWQALLAHPGGWTSRLELRDAAHWVFTDFAAFAPQLQQAGLMSAAARTDLVGAIEPARSVPAVRTGVREFFARHLCA
ncbi:alpha/beta hydrolase [Actinopolymorpha sp. NPDC004070]|uniref:alpha/beta hydrolase n=1 Tax=Actinopolymorpha sp. NPDC004070 TaxID=3154548 RepID=UPI0033B8D5E5